MTNPAPKFRPRRSRRGSRGRPFWLYAGLAGVGAAFIAGAIILAVRLSDDDGPDLEPDETAVAASTAGSADDRAPTVNVAPFGFVVQLGDIEPGWETEVLETFIISPEGFATGQYFSSIAAGESAVQDFCYVDGYQAQLAPIGKSADVALGKHYIRSETYRFCSAEGARGMWELLDRFHAGVEGSVREVDVLPLGNASSAFRILSGTVAGTELPGAYHRFMTVRGNMLFITQVFGALQYTSIQQARDYAVIIDEKVLGQRPAPTPTPPAAGSAIAAPTLPPTPEP
jgi:hypothetical protein